MTVPELIANVLDKIRRDFYGEKIRDFMRDKQQLIRAIATYGYECNQRAWNFQADFIYQDLMNLLLKIRTSEADIGYLPVYLEGAIRRHLGQRAEELSARAKALPTKIANVITETTSNCKVVEAVRQPSAVEIFSEVYRGIGKIQRSRKKKKVATVKQQQEQLL